MQGKHRKTPKPSREDFLLDLAAKEREEYYIDQYLKARESDSSMTSVCVCRVDSFVSDLGFENLTLVLKLGPGLYASSLYSIAAPSTFQQAGDKPGAISIEAEAKKAGLPTGATGLSAQLRGREGHVERVTLSSSSGLFYQKVAAMQWLVLLQSFSHVCSKTWLPWRAMPHACMHVDPACIGHRQRCSRRWGRTSHVIRFGSKNWVFFFRSEASQ